MTCSVHWLPRAPPPLLICSGVSHLASSLLHGWKHLAPRVSGRVRVSVSGRVRVRLGLRLGLGVGF